MTTPTLTYESGLGHFDPKQRYSHSRTHLKVKSFPRQRNLSPSHHQIAGPCGFFFGAASRSGFKSFFFGAEDSF